MSTQPEKSLQEVADDILAALPTASTPAALFEQLTAVNDGAAKHLERMRWYALLCAGLCCEDTLKEHPSFDKDAVLRVVANQFFHLGCFLVRSLKRRAGEDIIPARVALVAYSIAEQTLQTKWEDRLSEEVVGDHGSLREMLEEVYKERRDGSDGETA